MKKIFYAIGLMAAAGGVSTSASAAQIEYTLSGTGSGTLDGTFFSGNVTITSVGDTTTSQPCLDASGVIPGCSFVINQSLVLDLAGLGSFEATNPSIGFVNNLSNIFGFSEVVAPMSSNVNTFAFVNLAGTSDAFQTWDGTSDLAAIATDLQLNTFFAPFVATSGGNLVFDTATAPTPASFSARLLSGPEVPEPSTWLMMILGFGMLGAAMRLQRKPEVTVTYA